MLVVYLTIAAAALFVLLLAGYLTAIAWALTRARRNVIRLADVLEQTGSDTAVLQQRIDQTDHGVAEVAAELRQASGALTRAVKMLGRTFPD